MQTAQKNALLLEQLWNTDNSNRVQAATLWKQFKETEAEGGEEDEEKCSRAQLVQQICDLAMSKPCPPSVHYADDEITADIAKIRAEKEDFIAKETPWSCAFEFKNFETTPVFIGWTPAGMKISGRATLDVRMATGSHAARSIAAAWTDRAVMLRSAAKFWTVEKEARYPTEGNWRRVIRWTSYLPAQFRPSAAKTIYAHFGGGAVLDFSSGWGDRLVGALACPSVTSYTGIDPNQRLVAGYEQIQRLMNGEPSASRKTVRMICSAAENAETLLGDSKFDIVFTSPPYFNREHYLGENQSHIRYKTVDSWLRNFLFVAVSMSIRHLKVGGHLIININDLKQGKGKIALCDPLWQHVSEKHAGAMQWIGCYGYKVHHNMGCTNKNAAAKAEPVLIWKKVRETSAEEATASTTSANLVASATASSAASATVGKRKRIE